MRIRSDFELEHPAPVAPGRKRRGRGAPLGRAGQGAGRDEVRRCFRLLRLEGRREDLHAGLVALDVRGQEIRVLSECLWMKQRGHQPMLAAPKRSQIYKKARAAGLDAVLFESPQQLAGDLRVRGARFNY